jgi:hypothetical protein
MGCGLLLECHLFVLANSLADCPQHLLIQPEIAGLPLLPLQHDPCLDQRISVMAEQRETDAGMLGDLAARGFVAQFLQVVDDTEPPRLAQGFEDGGLLLVGNGGTEPWCHELTYRGSSPMHNRYIDS